MATLSSTLTLASTDLTSDTLDLTSTTTFTASHTSGMARANLTSTSKVTQLFISDGDGAVADVSSRQGQYIDITDNHGLKKRYVFTTADGSGAADGTIIVADTDIGSTTDIAASFPDLIGGICVNITDGDTEHAILTQLLSVINATNGHNGSITAAAVATQANGPQSSTFTNPTTGEGATFLIDNANSTWQDIHSTTNSAADHNLIVDKSKFADPAILYVKNTSAYHAANNIVYLYYDNHGAENVMEIRGGQFVYMPLVTTNNLYAYTSTVDTIVEFMIIGTEA